ncbi:DUF736 family protein [Rhizobium sp. YK2]|uniref:DUF736 family protein n=1 Tax=Rhizobium sp. YK2 TaxID=1860096 RepID=UPI00084BD1C3|nr:DUF736 family protein [Rhizobium sp. YK2]OEC93614.1 hypothetical protein A9Z06_09325 [Rhizobium sp. YK2]
MPTKTAELTNYIQFIEDGARLKGNIASIAYDVDVSGELYTSGNPKAPAYRLFAKSPRGRPVEIGGLWKKQNRANADYYTLSINTGFGKLNANLGRYPGQDDEDFMAIISWD